MRRDVVILDGVAHLDDSGLPQTADRPDHRGLDVFRQRRADAVAVDAIAVAALGLEEDLVAQPIGKTHDLVLDAGAIARPARRNAAGVHRGAVEVGADQIMHRGVRVGDPAGDLRLRDPIVQEGKRLRFGVAGLFLEVVEPDRVPGHARGRAGLEAAECQTQVF